MIAASKRRWLRWLFRTHGRRRVFRTFGALRVHGAQALGATLDAGPVVAVVNHCSWWDAMMVLLVSEQLVPCDAYAMMDAAQLRSRPYFAGLGAFGVERESPRDGVAAIRYAAGLLDRPGRVVWVFPQGEERPAHERPLRFFRGAERIAQLSGATVVPVGLHYAFGSDERPDAWISIGAGLSDAAVAQQTAKVEYELARIAEEQSTPGTHDFATFTARHRPERLPWSHRVLAAMTPLRALEAAGVARAVRPG